MLKTISGYDKYIIVLEDIDDNFDGDHDNH